jgi:GLPGLI family protein
MRTYLILSVFFNLIVHSQVTRIDYFTYTKNTIDTTDVRTFLLFDKDESIFIWNSIKNTESADFIKDKDDVVKFTKTLKDTVGLRVYNFYKIDTLKIIDKFLQNKFRIKEEKNIKWDILNESKSIGGYNCMKAITIFRGRRYNVWFTHEIPIPSGPWKLYGLPGLILEAIDEENEVSFKLKSIKKSEFNGIKKLYEIFNFDEISLRDFVEKKDIYHKEIHKEIISKLPRGTNIEVLNFSSRNGIEKKYEWEN